MSERMEPESLVMRQIRCFYCGANENISEALVGLLEGILACPAHADDASADAAAYLARSRLVSVHHILARDKTKKKKTAAERWLRYWDDGARPLAVRRSSGAIDRFWQIVLNNTRISGDSTRGSGAGGMRRKGLYTDMKEQVMSRGTWRTACTVAFLPPDF
jgi:hypothetical protein